MVPYDVWCIMAQIRLCIYSFHSPCIIKYVKTGIDFSQSKKIKSDVFMARWLTKMKICSKRESGGNYAFVVCKEGMT